MQNKLDMRGKAIFPRSFTAGSFMLLYSAIMLIAFGCKEKTEEQTKQFVFNLDELLGLFLGFFLTAKRN